MKWIKIFIMVSCGALAGMVMGALFGFGAGSIAPNFFASVKQWRNIQNVEPRGVAVVFGGVAGVLLGGGLAAFAIVVECLMPGRLESQNGRDLEID